MTPTHSTMSGSRNLRTGVMKCIPFAGVIALVLSVFPLAAAGPVAAGGWAPSASSWSNGVLRADFDPHLPAVTVAPARSSVYGLYAGLGALEELSPSGSLVASSSAAATSWSVTPSTAAGVYTMSYGGRMAVLSAAPSRTFLGTVNVLVNFTSSAAADPTSLNSTSVEFTVFAGGWPWVGVQDRLAVGLPVWPNSTSDQHLGWATGAPSRLDCVSNENASSIEYLDWAPTATASSMSGDAPLQVTAMISGNQSLSNVLLVFGGQTGGYASLHYDPRVGLTISSKILGLPLYEYVVVGSAAGAVSALAALGFRRSRQRRWSLEGVVGA
jgi:hypothetical protein